MMVSEQSISFKSIQYLDKFDLVVRDASDGSVTRCCDMIWQALAISRFGTFGDVFHFPRQERHANLI
jgi:hypothetical protein